MFSFALLCTMHDSDVHGMRHGVQFGTTGLPAGCNGPGAVEACFKLEKNKCDNISKLI